MIANLRRIALSLLACLGFASPAGATTTSTEYTDLWWNASEGGWGLNVIQQGNILFTSMFVYGSDGSPRWFYSPAMLPAGAGVYSGSLRQSGGSYYATIPYNPGIFTETIVGNMTLTFTSPTTATLSYSISGVNVTKQLVRYGFGANNLAGNYIGGLTAISNNCSNSSNNGTGILVFHQLAVQHSGASITMTVDFFATGSGVASRCTFAGSYSQNGRLGSISNGTYSCSFGGQAGNAGTFNMSQIEAQQTGFSGYYAGSDQFCGTYSGYFGGVRDVF